MKLTKTETSPPGCNLVQYSPKEKGSRKPNPADELFLPSPVSFSPHAKFPQSRTGGLAGLQSQCLVPTKLLGWSGGHLARKPFAMPRRIAEEPAQPWKIAAGTCKGHCSNFAASCGKSDFNLEPFIGATKASFSMRSSDQSKIPFRLCAACPKPPSVYPWPGQT